jgi:hypothetical protein
MEITMPILCPIALTASCLKCPVVKVCPLKSVLGDYKPDDNKNDKTDNKKG